MNATIQKQLRLLTRFDTRFVWHKQMYFIEVYFELSSCSDRRPSLRSQGDLCKMNTWHSCRWILQISCSLYTPLEMSGRRSLHNELERIRLFPWILSSHVRWVGWKPYAGVVRRLHQQSGTKPHGVSLQILLNLSSHEAWGVNETFIDGPSWEQTLTQKWSCISPDFTVRRRRCTQSHRTCNCLSNFRFFLPSG